MSRVLALAALLAGLAAAAGAQPLLPTGFQEQTVFSGLVHPTAVRFAPNGQVFVAEKSGLVKVFDGLADTTPTVVIDLRTQVHNFWDRGLLGLAVDPLFPLQPYIWVLYAYDAPPGGTAPTWGQVDQTDDGCPNPPGATGAGCVVTGRLSRIQVDPGTMQGTEQPLITNEWCQQYPSHSIGDLAFGPDGALYASGGDGASFNFADYGQDPNPPRNPCDDPPAGYGGVMTSPTAEGGALRSQDILTPSDPTSLNGTVLRIDPTTGAAWPGNPLAGGARADDDRIVAHGLRNPFRIAFRPGTNELWLGDVGWNVYEELDRVADVGDGVVENFGWPCYEGAPKQPGYQGLDLCAALYAGVGLPSVRTNPVYAYTHGENVVPGDTCAPGGSSITGVAFYQGGAYPAAFANAAFIADSTRNCIWTIFAGPGGAPNPANRAPFVQGTGGRVVDLQIGPGGDLYYVDFDGGRVARVSFFAANQPPTAALQALPTSGLAPLFVQFDASGSSDPEDGANLLYDWDLDGDGSFGDASGPSPGFTYVQPGVYLARVQVTDTALASDEESIQITAGNSPPVATITSPAPGHLWTVGEDLVFAGEGHDPQDGALPPSQLDWEVILHHCAAPDDCHTHPLTGFQGVAGGSFDAPDHEYPAWLELRLTATDLSAAGWLNGDWARRRQLTFSNPTPETLVDFPVLVTLDPTRIDYALTGPNGADLRFTDASGGILDHEVEAWNPGGVSQVWVRVPQITALSTSDFIYLYYGSPTAPPAENPAGVWSNGYAAVWHLDASLQDSTGQANDGSDSGTSGAGGRIGAARYFNGGAWIDAGADPSLALTGQLTLEAWVKIDDPNQTGFPRVLSKKPVWNAPHGYHLEYQPSGNTLSLLGSGDDYLRANNVDLDTSWHYLATAASGGAGSVYVDGVDRTSDATLTPLVAGPTALTLGRETGGGGFLRGALDEVRVSSVRRSSAWIAAQHLSMIEAFVSYGAEQTPSTLSHTTSLLLQPQTTTLTLDSVPVGLDLVIGGASASAPFSEEVIVGSSHSIDAPAPQIQGNGVWDFSSWSDAGGQAHNVTVPGPTTLTATFGLVPACRDGLDNDSDGLVDHDGAGVGPPDPQCNGNPEGLVEAANACGLGAELAALLPALEALRRRRRRAR